MAVNGPPPSTNRAHAVAAAGDSAKPELPKYLASLVSQATDIKGKVRISGFNTYDAKVPNSKPDMWTITVSQGSGKGAKVQEFVCSDKPAGTGKILEKDPVQIQKVEHPVDN